MGRLTTEKNVQALVEIEQKLISAGAKNYRFLIVGEGGQENWVRSHLQKAKFTGVLNGDALAAAYRSLDVLVFPSLTDTFGLVILEAMASGVPVILSEETGKRIGVQDNVSGFLSDDFAASTLRLMHDEALRKAMERRRTRSLARRVGIWCSRAFTRHMRKAFASRCKRLLFLRRAL